jgi:hypothetical protein
VRELEDHRPGREPPLDPLDELLVLREPGGGARADPGHLGAGHLVGDARREEGAEADRPGRAAAGGEPGGEARREAGGGEEREEGDEDADAVVRAHVGRDEQVEERPQPAHLGDEQGDEDERGGGPRPSPARHRAPPARAIATRRRASRPTLPAIPSRAAVFSFSPGKRASPASEATARRGGSGCSGRGRRRWRSLRP